MSRPKVIIMSTKDYKNAEALINQYEHIIQMMKLGYANDLLTNDIFQDELPRVLFNMMEISEAMNTWENRKDKGSKNVG